MSTGINVCVLAVVFLVGEKLCPTRAELTYSQLRIQLWLGLNGADVAWIYFCDHIPPV